MGGVLRACCRLIQPADDHRQLSRSEAFEEFVATQWRAHERLRVALDCCRDQLEEVLSALRHIDRVARWVLDPDMAEKTRDFVRSLDPRGSIIAHDSAPNGILN